MLMEEMAAVERQQVTEEEERAREEGAGPRWRRHQDEWQQPVRRQGRTGLSGVMDQRTAHPPLREQSGDHQKGIWSSLQCMT